MATERPIAFVAGGIGDQLYHFTQMQTLTRFSAEGRIDVACMHANIMRKIVSSCRWAGAVIDNSASRHPADIKAFLGFVSWLKQQDYTHAYILHRSTSFKLACWLAGIKVRVGLADGAADRMLLTHPLSLDDGGERRRLWGHRPFIAAIDSFVDTRLKAVQASQGDVSGSPVVANIEAVEQIRTRYGHLPRPWVVINLFAQDVNRRWDIEHAGQTLSQSFRRIGGTYFMNAGPDASAWHRQLLQRWTGPKDALILTQDDYADVIQDIALYHLADAYLGVDSFTANLAFNCDLPALVLFAKDEDKLSYRPFTKGLAPVEENDLSSLSPELICDEIGQLLADTPKP